MIHKVIDGLIHIFLRNSVSRCPFCRKLFLFGGLGRQDCGKLTRETMIINGKKFPSKIQLTCPKCRYAAKKINITAGLPYEDELGVLHLIEVQET